MTPPPTTGPSQYGPSIACEGVSIVYCVYTIPGATSGETSSVLSVAPCLLTGSRKPSIEGVPCVLPRLALPIARAIADEAI